MDSLVIDDDAVEVEEDRLNHAVRIRFLPSPFGTRSIKRRSSPSLPTPSTNQSFRSALQTAAAVARSRERPNVEALHSARVHSSGSPDNQDPRAGDPSSLSDSATS